MYSEKVIDNVKYISTSTSAEAVIEGKALNTDVTVIAAFFLGCLLGVLIISFAYSLLNVLDKHKEF